MSLLVEIQKDLGPFRLEVGFEARDGVTGVLGASGCGKSLTLKCIAGSGDARTRDTSSWTAGCSSTGKSGSICPPSGGRWAISSRTTPCSPT